MKRLFILMIVALFCSEFHSARPSSQATPALDQRSDNYSEKLGSFEEFVSKEMEKHNVPGLTIGVVKDDYMWVKGFGYADLENKVSAKSDSAYRLASVQKSMTAAAVLQLAEGGKLNLDAEIQRYVPYFP